MAASRNQPTVPTVNNSSTVYTQSFSGNQATYSQSFSLLSILPTLTCARRSRWPAR